MSDHGLKLALSLAADDLELIVEYLDRFADVDDGQSNEAMRALCATKRIKNLHERIAAGGWLPKNELSYRLDQAAGQVVRESCPSTAHAGVPVVAPASTSVRDARVNEMGAEKYGTGTPTHHVPKGPMPSAPESAVKEFQACPTCNGTGWDPRLLPLESHPATCPDCGGNKVQSCLKCGDPARTEQGFCFQCDAEEQAAWAEMRADEAREMGR